MTANIQTSHPHVAAQAGINEWHRIVAELDFGSKAPPSIGSSASARREA